MIALASVGADAFARFAVGVLSRAVVLSRPAQAVQVPCERRFLAGRRVPADPFAARELQNLQAPGSSDRAADGSVEPKAVVSGEPGRPFRRGLRHIPDPDQPAGRGDDRRVARHEPLAGARARTARRRCAESARSAGRRLDPEPAAERPVERPARQRGREGVILRQGVGEQPEQLDAAAEQCER